MTEAELTAIRARLAAVPAGPWWVDAGGPDETCSLVSADNCEIASFPFYAPCRNEGVEKFVANAPTDIALLLSEVDRLRADLAEALATLANERGEGKPPCEGWERNDIDTRREGVAWYTRWEADGSEPGEDDTEHTRVAWVRREEGCMVEWMWEIERSVGWILDKPLMSGRAPTARAAMRDASAAKGGAR